MAFPELNKNNLRGHLVALLLDEVVVVFELVQNGLDLNAVLPDLFDSLNDDFWLHGPFELHFELFKLGVEELHVLGHQDCLFGVH